MNLSRASVAAAILFLQGSFASLGAQTAREIVERHLSALGGREALEAIQTMRYIRTVQNTENDSTTLQSRTVFLTRRPYLYRTERPETGRIYVSDGRGAWEGVRQSEPDSINWEEASWVLRLRDLDFDRPFGSFLDYDRKGHSARYVGKTELDGIALETSANSTMKDT